ncbi:MAG: inositol monophosphatase family protein [bacterium]|nr:inositol monophosphatase family protein [bacterium]
MSSYSTIIHFASQLARKSGRYLLEGFHKREMAYTNKHRHEIVTKYDIGAEKIILSAIRKQFPDHGIYSEESGREGSRAGYVWVVDPLDGTSNFEIKSPLFSTSITLMYELYPVLTVVYAPVTKELFVAQSGQGAWLNGRRLRVRPTKQLAQSFILTCHGHSSSSIKEYSKIHSQMKLRGKITRQLGSASLECAYVAAGRVDGFIFPQPPIWDVAGGALLIWEAGGRVTDFAGRDWNTRSRDFLGSNGLMHKSFLKEIRATR